MRVSKQTGYTILEVLIFMAVSSLMFVSAMGAISGRQKQVQFTQSVQEFDAKIKDVINDVTTSYYPTNATVGCSISGGEVQINTGINQNIGTNSDCIYVGKVIHFQSEGDGTDLRIYAMAGKRYSDSKLTPSTSISNAKPKAVTSTQTGFTESAENFTTLYGLRVTRVFNQDINGALTDYGSVGVMSNFGGSSISEAQSVQIGGIRGSLMGGDTQISINRINQITDNPAGSALPGYFEKDTDGGVVICLESPENKKASLTFGAKGSSTTSLQIDNYNPGCV